MAKHFTFILLASILILQTKAHTNCSNELLNPHIPTKSGQRSHQNDSVFELRCEGNTNTTTTTTTIHFPSYGHDLVVKSISYDTKKLDLIDPKNCVHEVFLNLDLSLTPFRYYYVVKNYTYLNCSAKLSPSFLSIPCLSGYDHFVYTVEPSMEVPSFCKAIRTKAIPFEYSPYLADNSFGLGLTWGSLQVENGGFKVGLLQGMLYSFFPSFFGYFFSPSS